MIDYSFLFYDRFEANENVRMWELVRQFEDRLDSHIERRLRAIVGCDEPLEAKLAYIKPILFTELFQPQAVRSQNVLHENREVKCWEDIKEHTRGRLSELFDSIWSDAKRRLDHAVFFYFWSRDCDQCESDHAYRFSSWYKAAQYITSFYDGLEGPGTCEPMDLQGYLSFEASFYDHRAAQYNY